MIITLSTEQEYIYAYIEWEIVDEKNRLCPNGKYIYIKDVWIHPNHRFNGTINYFIKKIFEHESSKEAEFYFYNNKKHNTLSGIKPISKVIRRVF